VSFVAGVLGLLLFIASEPRRAVRWLAVTPAGVGLMVLQSPFTVSNLVPIHFAPVFPLMVVAVAGALARVPSTDEEKVEPSPVPWRPNWRTALLLAPAALVALIVMTDVRRTLQLESELARHGGLSTYSDGIYRLTSWLETQPGPVVALDWGQALQVQFLSQGRVVPDEVFGYSAEPDDSFKQLLQPYLDQPDALFVFNNPRDTTFQRRAAFEALAAPKGTLQTVQVIQRRDGADMYEVLRIEHPVP
jgi:hypothetical protein